MSDSSGERIPARKKISDVAMQIGGQTFHGRAFGAGVPGARFSLEMTSESQRIAIAEACGWYQPKHTFAWLSDVPDYLNDLNAMHEAEKVLKGKQIDIYREYFHSSENYGMFSTAAQRAERFLKVLGLWKDS